MRTPIRFILPAVGFILLCVGVIFYDSTIMGLGKESTGVRRRGDTNTSVLTLSSKFQQFMPSKRVANSKGDAPLFILHVGPKETGASAIQHAASHYESILRDDNIYFLGNHPDADSTLHGLYKTCFSAKAETPRENDCKAKWNAFQELADFHFQRNHNVFVSEEMFSAFHDEADAEVNLWKHLVPLLRHTKWRIRIIFSYRRYYEWLPSKYYQLYNPQVGGKRERWPDMNGRVTPNFPPYMENTLQKTHKHPSNIKRRWEERFPNHLQVFNLHSESGEEHVVKNFFCQEIPEASELCNYLIMKQKQSEEEIQVHQPPQKRVHFDMIAQAAYSRGWIDKAVSRSAAADEIEEFAKNELGLGKLTDFPVTCLSDQQKELLLDVSLSLEAEMTSDAFFASSRGEAELRSGFDDAVEDGLFCSVNVDKTFDEDSRWQKFFEDMNAREQDQLPTSVEIAVNHKNGTRIKSIKDGRSQAKILCLYEGDEGSTVLSEVIGLHPHVYSPQWKIEPVNPRNWAKGDFTLQKQLDAIRFLLRMPTNTTRAHKTIDKFVDETEYRELVGDARATYLKARVCKNEKNVTRTWTDCMSEVLDNLLCGEKGETVDHLVLPIRYGFDRICSKYVHQHKDLYKRLSQFHGDNGSKIQNVTANLSVEDAKHLEGNQERYLEEFLQTIKVAQTRCPTQSHRTKIHIFDYDKAKREGMEDSLRSLFAEIGLRNEKEDLDFGTFGERKPSNYCERIFDAESQHILHDQELFYEQWLRETCEGGKNFPWCSYIIEKEGGKV